MSGNMLTSAEESALYDAYRFSDDAVRLADVAQQIADRAFAAGQAAASDELVAQAEAARQETLAKVAASIRQRIRTHGAGMRHGCDAGRSNYCEAWRLILADVEAQARAPHPQNDTTTEEDPCSTRP